MSRRRAPARLRSEILDEASDWFVELNEDPQNQETRAGFLHWLHSSPEHVRAYLEIAAHWEDSAPGPAARIESIEELIALGRSGQNIVALPGSAGQRAVSESTSGSRRALAPSTRLSTWVAVAASVLVTVAVVIVASHQFVRASYSTAIGEQRSLRLDDGSTVDLNSRSRIMVRYTKSERHIDLLEGQALFHVASNKARPFVVQVGETRVRAVGTQFDVYRKESGTTVTVIEGTVALEGRARDAGRETTEGAAEPPAGGARVLATAGEQVRIAQSGSVQRNPAANIDAATAWTQRRLIFTGAPLSEVVEEFNRYNAIPLQIADPTLKDAQISGAFSSSDPSSLIRFLREVGMYEVRETDTAIQITRK